MPNAVKLERDEFTEERVMPLLRELSDELAAKNSARHSLADLRADFCDNYQELMVLGVGHAWVCADRGILLALKSRDIFSQRRRSAILLVGVSAPYRGSSVARELFEAYENWARVVGCVDVSGASHSACPRDASWVKHGYVEVETIFSKSL